MIRIPLLTAALLAATASPLLAKDARLATRLFNPDEVVRVEGKLGVQASIAFAEGSRIFGRNPNYFLIRHAIFLTIGLAAAGAAFQVPIQTWQRWSPYLFLGGIVLLMLVLIPGLGRDVNGARRWLPLFVVNLQPSELMKLFVVLYAADFTVRKMNVMHSLKKAFLPMFAAMGTA